ALFCRCSCLSCPCPPRDLHSFPTRRSSDLSGVRRVARPMSTYAVHSLCWRIRKDEALREELRGDPRRVLARFRLSDAEREALLRSEEHTSELQSPDHLVCRLLLEKKKHTS